MYRLVCFAALFVVQFDVSLAQDGPAKPQILSDIEYANVDGISLKLDLIRPNSMGSDSNRPAPCVVFVHGGGWKNGSKKSGHKIASWLADNGFAVATIDYRLTDVAQWPAQINDCYAAVRWVRDHAKQYNIDANRVGAWGTSAGGHLAALMGTRSCPDDEMTSSRVQAVCDWFGPSELMTMPPNNVGDVANSNGAKLLGTTVREVPELAADASALDQVSADDAAFLIMHGEKDPGVPLEQSQKLHAKLVRHGVASQLRIVPGAGHGGKEFSLPEYRDTVLRFFQSHLMSHWNQGGGPSGRFVVANNNAPTKWSVVRDQNIRWRKSLPETGQSTVVTWGDRVFFTTMEPVKQDSTVGSNIVAWCCQADSGETIWKRKITAKHPLRLSGCFSDSTAPPPVTDGQRVCFFNASGSIACFDFDGTKLWHQDLMPVGRTQPFLSERNVVFIKQTYMPDEGGHFTHDHKDAPRDQWTQLQALDFETGTPAWSTTCGVNMGSGTLPMTLPDGRDVIIVGRGGGHSPPETPDGISMVSAVDGSTIWTLPLQKFMATMTFNVYGDLVLVFDRGDHIWVDASTGEIDRRVSFVNDIPLRARGKESDVWLDKRVSNPGKKPRSIIQHSNLLVGRYHYFRSYTQPWLGRVDVVSGGVEYLQLPVQLKRTASDQQLLWDPSDMTTEAIAAQKKSQRKPSKTLPVQLWAFTPNSMRNSSGHEVMGDNRSRGNGWGHHASQLPTVVGDHLYVPTMSGTVYVIRWNAPKLDESSIVAINDLGEVGEAWNRASLSFASGRLYAHTIKELICIGEDQ